MTGTTENAKDKSPFQWKWPHVTAVLVGIAGLLLAATQLCFDSPVLWPARCLAYLGLALGLAGFALAIYFRHETRVHQDRLEDKSVVKASIVEATTVEPRLLDQSRLEEIEEKKNKVDREIERLQTIGAKYWTEYEVLSLSQMMVDFLSPQDLIARTNSVMDELDEYATDSKYQYDREYYAKWQQRVDEAVKEIDGATDQKTDDKSERLRAVLKTLYEHLADFKKKWTEGSALVRDLLFVNAVGIPVFFTIGLVPVIHPSDPGPPRCHQLGDARCSRRPRGVASWPAPIRRSGSRQH